MAKKRGKRKATPAQLRALKKARAARFGSNKVKRRRVSMPRKKATKRRYNLPKNDEKLKTILPAGFSYGLVREWASDKLATFTDRLPLGNISDEAGMIGLLYALRRWVIKKKGLFRDVAKGGMYVEAARMGQATKDGQLGGIFNFGKTTTTSSGSVPIV